jgi:hypothetical protein
MLAILDKGFNRLRDPMQQINFAGPDLDNP